jgi:hypothetical protein
MERILYISLDQGNTSSESLEKSPRFLAKLRDTDNGDPNKSISAEPGVGVVDRRRFNPIRGELRDRNDTFYGDVIS